MEFDRWIAFEITFDLTVEGFGLDLIQFLHIVRERVGERDLFFACSNHFVP